MSKPSFKRRIKDLAYMLAFPVYSFFSSKTGFTVFYPSATGWMAYTRGRSFCVREPRLWVLEYFRHFVPDVGDVVFDVGGELGYETEQFSALVRDSGRVYVFECFPEHLEKLESIAKRTGNVEVVDRACWNEQTELEFFIGNTPGSNTAVPDAKGQSGQDLANEGGYAMKVLAEPLDLLWKRLISGRSVDFLKMDIEGAEYEALEGAGEMLKMTKRAVIAAYHIRDGITTAARVDEMLLRAGFKTRVDENFHVYAWR